MHSNRQPLTTLSDVVLCVAIVFSSRRMTPCCLLAGMMPPCWCWFNIICPPPPLHARQPYQGGSRLSRAAWGGQRGAVVVVGWGCGVTWLVKRASAALYPPFTGPNGTRIGRAA